MVKVKRLEVEWFRRFRNEKIPIGDRVTIIVGQNGTSKSTLLGMLAQPFGFNRKRSSDSAYIDNYHGLDLSSSPSFRQMNGSQFDFNCDQIFRLSEKHDYDKAYVYTVCLSLPRKSILTDGELVVRAGMRKKVGGRRMRFVAGPQTKSHESGLGNFPHPVIYLGLERLYPQAISEKCEFTEASPSKEDEEWYLEQYQTILCLEEPGNRGQFMEKSENKPYLTPIAESYDGKSCSAGQDNLSQILTAIRSFHNLKLQLGRKYAGGLLLIDELDATLHARTQQELLKLLCQMSKELDLQIVATSHSLWLLELAYTSNLRRDVSLLFLESVDDKVTVESPYESFQEAMDHLKVETTKKNKSKPKKVSVLVEDDVTRSFFKNICGSKLNKYYKCVNICSVKAGTLKNIGQLMRVVPDIGPFILIADGDMANTWSDPPADLICLPGKYFPERVIFEHLRNSTASDPFWKKCGRTYSKQVAITSHGANVKADDTKLVKKWYEKQKQHWGRTQSRAFSSWIESNKNECLEFANKFIKLLRKHYKGDIPKSDIEKALKHLKSEAKH